MDIANSESNRNEKCQPQQQIADRAARIIADRFALPLFLAATIASLAGLGPHTEGQS
jgi:hypothetical protein